jgi:hypothetical protein
MKKRERERGNRRNREVRRIRGRYHTIASETLKAARNENNRSDDGERKETEDQSPLPPLRLLHR